MSKTLARRPYNFEAGNQPCQAFHAKNEGFGGNRHDCYGPYGDKGRIAGAPQCHAWVSFCDNCATDHHEGGWERCPTIKEIDRNPSRAVFR